MVPAVVSINTESKNHGLRSKGELKWSAEGYCPDAHRVNPPCEGGSETIVGLLFITSKFPVGHCLMTV